MLAVSTAAAQTRKPPVKPASPKPAVSPTPAAPAVDRGRVSGRTYTNETFGFELTFPDSWLIPDDDFEEHMRSQGFDLGLKPPTATDPRAQRALKEAMKRLTVLVTAYKYLPGYSDNVVVRIAVEDLAANPQIKDAVDYVDAVRSMYLAAKMPPGFSFSETQAEQLGKKQFAFIDLATPDSLSRMYVTVRAGHAILIKITYNEDRDLQVVREVLAKGNFALK
jgi:hypothetical protein